MILSLYLNLEQKIKFSLITSKSEEKKFINTQFLQDGNIKKSFDKELLKSLIKLVKSFLKERKCENSHFSN